MTTAYTRAVVLVVRPAVAAAINSALNNPSWDAAGGGSTFTVPLRAAGDQSNGVVGYWAAGAASPAMLTGLRSRLLAGGATSAEAAFIPAGTSLAAVSSQRIFAFDAAAWTPDGVLALLGVEPVTPAAV